MPNKESIRAWVAALRSGAYKQGIGSLRRADSTYCCLGVACEAYNKVTGKGGWDELSWMYGITLPDEVAEWLGLNSCPSVGGETAIAHNDWHGVDFAGIADLIEKEYLSDTE